ncbi:MAG: hypothetical protein FJ104_17360, partial [Deltaproteobacteria bacterium]|nr:hypothetical protein [Deltaproteobacteria bacterium]
ASVVDQQGYEISTGGAIQFFGITPGNGVLQVATLAGYSVELSQGGAPATCGVAADAGPCVASYLGTTGIPDPALQASSAIGVGAFGNVPPGEYVLTFSHPDMACTERLPESGFAGPTEDSITVAVVEGYITAQVGMVCQPGVL